MLQDTPVAGQYYGGYGYGYGYGVSNRRQLQAVPGAYGYGGYGYGYGYGSAGTGRRRLVEEQDSLMLEPQEQQSSRQQQVAWHLAEAQAHQTSAAKQLEQKQPAIASAAVAAALQHAQTAAITLALPAGQCYCRFDTDFNTWALGEGLCKDALYSKCKVCTWFIAASGNCSAQSS